MITELLDRHAVRSQEQLAELLADAGFPATQGTISRDLRELGIMRTPSGYRPPAPAPAQPAKPAVVDASEELRAALKRHVVSIVAAHALVVIKTPPGHASLLALRLDRRPMAGMMGTIAGDDTIFVATPSPEEAKGLAKTIGALLGAPVSERAA